ncbi:MAG: hypothetical protein U0136_15695 [Bdellovibrionota bacterium]
METEKSNFKRVNVLIREDQHQKVMDLGLSLSGLLRDLLDDRFSDTTVVLSVSKRTKKLYDNIISNFGVGDADLERFFVQALDRFLSERSREIEVLKKRLTEKP